MSDAAPLPRLGEVFFDVRGNSRSMRLSWYADTGVAVFSIWQAGMCTGTFRLPIGDLSRMIQILERGPSPQSRGRAPVSGARRGPERGRGDYPAEDDEIGLLDATSGAGGYGGTEYAADYGRSGHGSGQYAADSGTSDYPAADRGSAGYGDEYEQPGYGQAGYGDSGYGQTGYDQGGYDQSGYDQGAYQPADYGAGQPDGRDPAAYGYQPAGYGQGEYAEGGSPGRGGHSGADYAPGGYNAGPSDYLTGERPATGYRDGMPADGGPDYLSGGYGQQPDYPAGDRRRDDGRFPPDPGALSSAETDGTGYQEERFVPPYVRGGGESYRNDTRAGAAGYEGELDEARYPAGAPPVSRSNGYEEPQWPGEAYSSGADYRRR